MAEQDLRWRTSSWSGTERGNCVEVALTPEHAYVRDSKDRNGGTIEVSAGSWAAFIRGLKQG